MQIDCYTDESGFQKLEGGWGELLSRNQRATVFQTLEWNRSWWDSFGDSKELLLLAIAGEGGLLAGLAPLYRTQSGDGRRLLQLVGGIDLSDYLDLIYYPGFEEPVCMALLDHLRENYKQWDVLEFHNVPTESPTLELLSKAATELGLKITAEEEDVCPRIHLPSTWEEYLSTLSKKDRHELRRKMRKAGSAGGDKRYVVGEGNNLSKEVEEFFRLHGKSKKEKGEFLGDGTRRFFLDFTARFQRNGWLELSFLKIGGEMAASLLNFKYQERIYVYNSGFDPAFSSYSAGIAIIGHSIRAAIEEGYRNYDFLRGDEGYKYKFGATDYPVYRIRILSPK